MYGKSPLMKKLIGKQHNLPEGLKQKIEDSPMDMYNASPAKQTKFPNPPEAKKRKEKMKKNVDPFSIDEQAYENAQNDYNTSNPTKAQVAASKAKIKKERE